MIIAQNKRPGNLSPYICKKRVPVL